MNEALIGISLAFCALLLICFVVNLIVVARKGESSKWFNRGIYLSGVVAAAANAIRMIACRKNGTLFLASLVALICVLVAWVRMERGPLPDEMDEEEENGGDPQ